MILCLGFLPESQFFSEEYEESTSSHAWPGQITLFLSLIICDIDTLGIILAKQPKAKEDCMGRVWRETMKEKHILFLLQLDNSLYFFYWIMLPFKSALTIFVLCGFLFFIRYCVSRYHEEGFHLNWYSPYVSHYILLIMPLRSEKE